MEGIGKATEANMGSVLGINIYDVEEVESIPEADDNHIINSAIVLKSGGTKNSILFIPEAAFFGETDKDTANGTFWNQQIKVSILQNCPEVSSWLAKNREKQFIIELLDGNQMVNIIGSKEFPVDILKVKMGHPEKTEQENGIDMEFAAQSRYPANFYLMFENAEVTDRRTYSNAYSLSYS